MLCCYARMLTNVLINFDVRFYRMIHYSAKHSHAIGCLPVSPKPVSPKPDLPKLGLGVGVYPFRRNPIRRNWGLGLGKG